VPPTLAPPTPAPAAQAPSGEAPAPEEAAPAQAIVPGQPAAAPAQPPAVANAQPAGAGASEAAGSGPAATIAQFYRLIEQHAYDRAVQLWSQRMRDDYPPAQNIWGRFDQTQQLVVRRADVTALNEAAGRATVSVDLVEVLSSGERRRYVGSWSLVRGGSGWLLDQPSLLPAPLNG
jgi:hypothetical protein